MQIRPVLFRISPELTQGLGLRTFNAFLTVRHPYQDALLPAYGLVDIDPCSTYLSEHDTSCVFD